MNEGVPNADQDASPVDNIMGEDPRVTTTVDQTGEAIDNSSGEASDDPHKIEELAKAGHKDVATKDRNE